MFRHQKNHLPTPAMWFEFFPDGYSYGCGIICATPAFMEHWRKMIKANPSKIEDATTPLTSANITIEENSYKRSKAKTDGIDGLAGVWYDQKAPFVIKHVKNTKTLNQPKKLVKELSEAYTLMKPLYDFMLTATTSFNGDLEE